MRISAGERNNHDGMNTLFISDNQRGCWHLARHLERLGCNCWFASTTEEVRSLLGQRSFRLVLSTRPVTARGPLMQMLRAPNRFVFYSFPVEDSCLWFQAIPDILHGPRVSALRPSEFMSILDDLIARCCVENTRADAGQSAVSRGAVSKGHHPPNCSASSIIAETAHSFFETDANTLRRSTKIHLYRRVR